MCLQRLHGMKPLISTHELNIPSSYLDLEATRLAASTSLLELTALGAHTRCCGRVGHSWRLAEESLRLARLHAASQEHSALAHGRAQGELVECDALAASLHDACSRSLCEAEGTDRKLRHIEESLVIRDCAHHACNLSVLTLHVLRELRQGHRNLVAARH